MIWTAIDPDGQLVRVAPDGEIDFVGLRHVGPLAQVYAPVVASDGTDALLAFREPTGPAQEPVWVVASNGANRVLPFLCEGKWPLGIRCLGPGRYEVACIGAQLSVVHRALIDVAADITISQVTSLPMDRALVLLEIMPDNTLRFANGDGVVDAHRFTRAGRTQLLTYWREVNGRVIGADADPAAPNRILLGDFDGWYLVASHGLSTAFPAYLSDDGTATVFEGQVYSLADIRTRPFDVPDVPVPPVPGYNPKPDLLRIHAELGAVIARLP